ICTSAGSLLYAYIARLRKREKARRSALESQNKLLLLEQQALQLQMNPHFIFNSLQSIQEFIFDKQAREAGKYLVKFSRLMRLFLESSKESFIFIQQEIELLSLYIDLEILRFPDKFDYQIDTGPHLDQYKTEIPSMLLQPFVENAIKHGLLPKEQAGFLHISFDLNISGKEIICQIKDNGIGRQEAFSDSNPPHKSRGTQLIEERRNMLNLLHGTNIRIEYEDITDGKGQAEGTIVTIIIPWDDAQSNSSHAERNHTDNHR
ncbi:MAG: histidine kinase, partial [Bacteroidota bacterium]